MLKLISLALMAVFTCGSGTSLPSTSIALPKEASNKTSHSDGLKHDSVDSFLESEEVIFYKEISDFYGNSFDLYELSPSGYAIYAKNESSTAFLEGSHSSYSPFHDFLDSDLYYLGLGSYYYQSGTSVIDIETGSPLDNIEEITNYSYSLSEDIFLESDESEIEPYKFVNIDDDTDLGSSSGSSSSGSGSSSSGGSTSSLTVTYNGFTCIKNYEYFKNLEYFPDQTLDGTCGVVATCMLIGYLDQYTDGDYIINDEYRDHEGTSQTLYDKITSDYFHYNGLLSSIWGGYPMANVEVKQTLKDYIKSECPSGLIKNTDFSSFVILNTHNGVRKKLDKGIPTIITMTAYDYSISDEVFTGKVPHTVIAYGYNKDDDTFLVHFGWSNNSTTYSQTIISGATIYSWNTCEYTGG